MPTRLKRTVRKLQPYIERMEPWSILLTYMAIGWCAYFAWFSPPNSARNVMGPWELHIQAILFSVGAIGCLWGHISDKIFIEEVGLIFSFFGGILYVATLTTFTIRSDNFWQNGQVFGLLLIALLLIVNRAVRIQAIVSSKWLRPNVDQLFNEAKI